MSDWLIPVVIAVVLLWGVLKNVDVFSEFVAGAKEGLSTACAILPVLVGLLCLIQALVASGGMDAICTFLAPAFHLIGLPQELIPLAILRPISGSGALSMYEWILTQYSPDSSIGMIGSVLVGCSETTFYTIAVYFGAVHISKTRYAIPAALLGDFAGVLLSVWTVGLFCG